MDTMSGRPVTPDICVGCGIKPHDGWTSKEPYGELCLQCWEKECDDSFWEHHNRMAYDQQVRLVAYWKRIAYGAMLMVLMALAAVLAVVVEVPR